MTSNLGAIFLKWMYWDAPRNIITLVRDFLAWVWQMFSIGYFVPRLFSPWHRDVTSYGRGFDLAVWTQAFVFNGISRIMGAILRIFFIVTGLVLEVVVLLAGIIFFLAWILLPLIIVYLLITGIDRV